MKTERNSAREDGRRVSRYARGKLGVPRRANGDGEGASLRAAGSKYYFPRRSASEVHSYARTMPRLYGAPASIHSGRSAGVAVARKYSPADQSEPGDRDIAGLFFKFSGVARRLPLSGHPHAFTCETLRWRTNQSLVARSRYLAHLLGRIGTLDRAKVLTLHRALCECAHF